MANRIIETSIEARRFVPSTSRYAESTVLYYGDQNKVAFETYKRQPVVPSAADLTTQIGPGTEFRPDLISFQAYGIPDFWWKIMEFNKIFDIYEFKSGRTIRLPQNVY